MLHFPLKDAGRGKYNVHPEDEICIYADAKADKEAVYKVAVRLFTLLAPQCIPLEDTIGVITQIDNYCTGVRSDKEIALKAQREEWRENKRYLENDNALKMEQIANLTAELNSLKALNQQRRTTSRRKDKKHGESWYASKCICGAMFIDHEQLVSHLKQKKEEKEEKTKDGR